jgi:hypothetical protein
VGRWQACETLYRDFTWQYGLPALGWYRAVAAAGGNTPLSLVLAGAAACALAWILVACLIFRMTGRNCGGGLALVGPLPLMSSVGLNALNGPHGTIEMLLLAIIAWTLSRSSSDRTSTAW